MASAFSSTCCEREQGEVRWGERDPGHNAQAAPQSCQTKTKAAGHPPQTHAAPAAAAVAAATVAAAATALASMNRTNSGNSFQKHGSTHQLVAGGLHQAGRALVDGQALQNRNEWVR